MSPSFISGSKKYLPDTAIPFDKFHLVKEVNKAMDEVRKMERKDNFELKGHKYTFLKGHLNIKEQEQRNDLMDNRVSNSLEFLPLSRVHFGYAQ
jgi:transposase